MNLDEEPTFEEYVAARKVVFYEYEQLRKTGRFGTLSIARDEMVANIVFKSCERFRRNRHEQPSRPIRKKKQTG
jgi:hypothetical protein